MSLLNALLARLPSEKPFLLLVVGYPARDCQVPVLAKQSLAGHLSTH